MSLAAGKLDRRITIQKRVETQDSITGAPVVSWVDLEEIWADFKPVSPGRETVSSGQTAAFADSKFTVRKRPDLAFSPKQHRIVMGGLVYDVIGVPETSRGETIEILAFARAE